MRAIERMCLTGPLSRLSLFFSGGNGVLSELYQVSNPRYSALQSAANGD